MKNNKTISSFLDDFDINSIPEYRRFKIHRREGKPLLKTKNDTNNYQEPDDDFMDDDFDNTSYKTSNYDNEEYYDNEIVQDAYDDFYSFVPTCQQLDIEACCNPETYTPENYYEHCLDPYL